VSGEDVDVVRRMFAAWLEGDVKAMLACIDEDVMWHPSIWSSGGVSYHGHAGVREWASQFRRPDRRIKLEPLEFRQGPAGVAVTGRVTEYRGREPTTTVSVGWAFELAGGRIVRGEGFSDPVHALRIAGIWD
jgi:ketosteroid isomerase-like protein